MRVRHIQGTATSWHYKKQQQSTMLFLQIFTKRGIHYLVEKDRAFYKTFSKTQEEQLSWKL